MRRLFVVPLLLGACAVAWPVAGQVVSKSNFNTGVGITLANRAGFPFSQQTYADLVAGGEPDAGTLAVDLGSTNYETMLRFNDLFGAEVGRIPDGAHIVQATVALRTVDSGDGASIHRLLLPFEPATDTWDNWGSGAGGRNTTPGVDPDDVEAVAERDFLQGPTIDGITKMDVTASLRAWQSAGNATAANAANQGWLMDAIDTGGWDFAGFDAEAVKERPVLSVTYTDIAPTTLSFQQNTDGYVGASDTYLSETSPNTPFGAASDLIVGNVDEGGNRTISLLKFEDIIGDEAGQLPNDAQLVRATLKLQLFQPGDGLELRRLGADWSAETATWATFAEAAGVSLQRDASTVGYLEDQAGQFVEFDVTGGVQAWLSGADNFGWALTALPTSGSQTLFTAADFGADAPILELTYIPGAAVPEPASVVLLAGLLSGLGLRSSRLRSLLFCRRAALAVAVTSLATTPALAQIQTATFNTGTDGMYNDAFPDSTFAEFRELDGDPDLGDVSVDQGALREVFMRFEGPIFGAGAGLVPIDAFVVDARLDLQTTSRGGGAHLHRLLTPFNVATDTYNNWGSGLNGRNATPGVQADGVEAVEAIDVTTGFQELGISRTNVTKSLLAWQAAGDAASANAANLGWYFEAINDEGWDFNAFDGAVPPELNVRYSTIPPTMISFQEGVNGYAGTTDTYISQSDADASFGDADGVSIGGLDDNDGQRIGLMRFDGIIGAGAGQLPQNAVLIRAELKLHAGDDGDGVEIRQMLSAWSEDATWNTLIDSARMSLLTDDSVGEIEEGEIALDVTRSVQAWLDGDENLGWAITALLGSDSTSDLASSELSDNPPGDTDGNGEVDITDLNNVRNNFGSPDPIAGDTDGDNDVDINDLNAVRNNFGSEGGGPSGLRPTLEITFLPGAASAVPEPSTWVLLTIAGAAALTGARRKRRG